jgi:hypothetical protein
VHASRQISALIEGAGTELVVAPERLHSQIKGSGSPFLVGTSKNVYIDDDFVVFIPLQMHFNFTAMHKRGIAWL